MSVAIIYREEDNSITALPFSPWLGYRLLPSGDVEIAVEGNSFELKRTNVIYDAYHDAINAVLAEKKMPILPDKEGFYLFTLVINGEAKQVAGEMRIAKDRVPIYRFLYGSTKWIPEPLLHDSFEQVYLISNLLIEPTDQ